MASPMGMDFAENAADFRAGRCAFSPVTLFDVSHQRVGTAGQVVLTGDGTTDRSTRMATMAARETMAQAGVSGERMPMMAGTSTAAMPSGKAEQVLAGGHDWQTSQ